MSETSHHEPEVSMKAEKRFEDFIKLIPSSQNKGLWWGALRDSFLRHIHEAERVARREALEEAANLFSCWQLGVKDCLCGGCEFPRRIRALADEGGEA